MKGYFVHMEDETIKNDNFRKVLYTAHYSQLVLMSLKPGEDIGMETHASDQFFRFEKGEGEVIIDGNKYKVKDGDSVIVPGGSQHNVTNTSKTESMKLYTVYSQPNHKDGAVAKTKAKAEGMKEVFDGKTTE